jgi:hypothetical protein
MTVKRPRRVFRFTLRTMFLATTVLGIWLGWQLNLIRQRQAILKDLLATKSIQVVSAAEWLARYSPGMTPPPAASISHIRIWLGDKAIQEIWYTPYSASPTPKQMKLLGRLFPEAEFREIQHLPCHPGCFPRETLVLTPTGNRRIDTLRPGELVVTISPNGEQATAEIQSIFVTQNQLLEVRTKLGDLHTTPTQPLCLTMNKTIAAVDLKAGQRILYFTKGKTETTEILDVPRPTKTKTEKVFNLILGDSQIFVANHFLARSKPPVNDARQELTE